MIYFFKKNKNNIFDNIFINNKYYFIIIIISPKEISEAFSNKIISYYFLSVGNNLFESLHHALIRLFTMTFVKSMREYYMKSFFIKKRKIFGQK